MIRKYSGELRVCILKYVLEWSQKYMHNMPYSTDIERKLSSEKLFV